jgi:cell division protein FtsQ
MRKYNWKKILINTAWILAGIGAFVLLGAAMQKKSRKECTDIKIEITGVERHIFIDEKDVLDILNASGPVKGSQATALNLRAMETVVEKNPWVRNAEMFLDNNQVLQVRIEERQPVARVFTLDGNSFYVDSAAMHLPLSEKVSARVPAFTGFPTGKEILSRPDSALLHNIVKLGKYILADSFWMAQVSQVDMTPQSGFELIPVIGDHTVVFGNAENIDRKFKRLYTFYQKAWLQNGINTYEKLDVQYDGQVVAIRKGTGKAMIDSARAHQLMQGFLAQAALNDSISNSIPPNTIKTKKDSTAIFRPAPAIVKPVTKPVTKTNSVARINNKTGKKPLTKGKKSNVKNTVKKKPAAKPKAVMKN